MSPKTIEKLNYSQFVGFIKERNRPSGGIKTVHTVAVNAFVDSSKHMLEIGSNTGFTSVNMHLLTGCKVTGIDSNPPSVEESREYAARLGAQGVSFMAANALELPFEDETFDLLWSSNVTSFIDDKNKAIAEYLRVLKPGGTLVVVPIYYRTDPPTDVLRSVSDAVGVEIKVWDKQYWDDLFRSTAAAEGYSIEKFYESDYRYLDRKSALPSYVDLLLGKQHLKNLSKEQKQVVRERCEHFMSLFNDNLQYAGYSIMLYQKRTEEDETEFFLSEKV